MAAIVDVDLVLCRMVMQPCVNLRVTGRHSQEEFHLTVNRVFCSWPVSVPLVDILVSQLF